MESDSLARSRVQLFARLTALFGSATLALGIALVVVLTRDPAVVSIAASEAVGKLRRDYDPTFDIYSPVPDPAVDLVFFPGLRDAPAWVTGVPLTTNSAGLRYPREIQPKQAGTLRIVLLGDSLVAAHAARYEDGVAPQLQELLERTARKEASGIERFEVVPVAVSGWNVFAQIRFLLHNLHVLQPSLVIHVLNHNDVDSGSGFILGSRLSALYDAQALFGDSHVTVASPRIVLREQSAIRSLLASYLIPESVRRWDQAAAEAEWLKQRLEQDFDAPYLVHCVDERVIFPVASAFLRFQPAERILVGEPWSSEETLLPLDGHPNGNGHRRWALGLARFLDRSGIVDLDPDELAREGSDQRLTTLADAPATEAQVRSVWEVERIPSGFRFAGGELIPNDGVRCIVGGVHARCILSTRSIFVLRRVRGESALDLELSFRPVSALIDRELVIRIDGARVQAIPMTGDPHLRLPLPESSRERDLVEVVLEAGGYCTDLVQYNLDGVFGAVPQAGQLVSIGLVAE